MRNEITLPKTKIMRCWDGRLNNLDKTLYWLYETNVLNKGEKHRKDTLFRSYYRLYNDGDTPRTINTLKQRVGWRYSDGHLIEQLVTDFISTILKKYKGKYNRHDFQILQKLENYSYLIQVLRGRQISSSIHYLKKVNLESLPLEKAEENLRVELRKVYKSTNEKIDLDYYSTIDDGKTIAYCLERVTSAKTINLEIEKAEKELKLVIDQLLEKINEAISTLKNILSKEY